MLEKNDYYGELDGNYYREIFQEFDKGRFQLILKNWHELIWGPLWYINRRIYYLWVCFFSLFYGIYIHYIIDKISSLYLSTALLIAGYFFLFILPNNVLYYVSVKKFICKHEKSESLTLSLFRSRFETELQRGKRKRREMFGD